MEALFSGSLSALQIASDIFSINQTPGHIIDYTLSTLYCQAADKLDSTVYRDARRSGGFLTTRILEHRQRQNARFTLLGFGSKYKRVDVKKMPVPVSMPPMKREPYKPIPIPIIPDLPAYPPPLDNLSYTPRLSEERIQQIIRNIPEGFLSNSELALLLWVAMQNEDAIAFDDSERGTYKSEYFPDYVMETIPHYPWQERPIRIPESIKGEIIGMLKGQVQNGNLEPSTSSYRSRVFAVKKPKGGWRVVHDLQPLNEVSVQDAMLPPNVSDFAESFIGYSVYGTMDLHSGYHHRVIHEDSRPLTACHTPIGNMQLTTLPMGYTNSMQEFQRATLHIIRHMWPDRADAFVDDVGVKGPKSRYGDKPIAGNPDIRQFIWEYAHTLYECLAVMKGAGATASGKKLVLATPRVAIVGHECDLSGIRPRHGIASKVRNWPIPRNPTDVRSFLGTIGVARNWIKGFARIAKPLTELTKLKQLDFEWTQSAQKAMDTLKERVEELTALKKIDIPLAAQASVTCRSGEANEGRLILAVDSSMIAVGYILYQMLRSSDNEAISKDNSEPDKSQPRLQRYPIRFGSITLNEVESRYGQPKIELYGLFRALKALEHLLWGLNVLVEVDASFLKAMVNSPGLPNAAATRWITFIQLFTLDFKHVPAEGHRGPDGLSRRPPASEDTDNTDPGEDFDESGPFIKDSRERGPIHSPQELPIIPDPLDINYIEATRLRTRPGEPTDVLVGRKGDTFEWLHLARVEPSEDTERSICHLSLIPAKRPIDRIEALRIAAVSASERADKHDEEMVGPDIVKDLQLHPNHILDDDREEYWKNIISYLQTLQVPRTINNRKTFLQAARKYYIFESALWRRTNDLPRRVILNNREREELIRQAHDESGHRGRDPTYRKLADFYFWPNMFAQIALYCRTCRQCQLRSSYHPKVMIQPTWVPTILRKFNLDLVEMGITSHSMEIMLYKGSIAMGYSYFMT
ncbi:MAG TPA: hypothetical protein VFE08_17165, partial [Candidatus Sulfotelmatobacter sp.]|nr:hypothetical protein [Candidatus Sulfotelmatobacter sp.]